MIDQLATQRLLGPFRGEAAVDRDALAAILVALGRIAEDRPDVASIDVNPLIVDAGRPSDRGRRAGRARRRSVLRNVGPQRQTQPHRRRSSGPCSNRAACSSRALPPIRASSGSCRSTTCWPAGTRARSSAPTCRARRCSACARSPTSPSCPTARSISSSCAHLRPPTSTCCGPARRRGCGPPSSRRAGYGEAGEEGRRAEAELVALADELGILLAGPNGQGVVSTPVSLCAQIVAPVPAPWPHRRGEPERQLRLQLPQLRPSDRRRHQQGRLGRQRGGGVRRRLPRPLRR